jgi:hypothetical protein
MYQHHIHTPFALCDEIVDKIKFKPMADVLIMFNLEFLRAVMNSVDFNETFVYYYTTDTNKARLAEILWPGIVVIDKLEDNMKFDVIVGNPPYQRASSKAHKLWIDFLYSSLDMSSGYVCMITPALIAVGGGDKIKSLREKAFPYLTHMSFGIEDKFSVGEEIVWSIFDKNNTATKVTILSRQDFPIEIQPPGRDGIYIGSGKIVQSILSKVENYQGGRLQLVSDYAATDGYAGPNYLRPKGIIVDIETPEYKYEFIHSGAQRFYTKLQHTYGGVPKILLNYSSSYKDMFYSLGVAGKQVEAIIVDDEQHGARVISALTKKLFLFYIDNEKSGGFNTGIYKLPAIDFTRIWTDQDLFDHFKLTQEEVDYILKTV